MSDKRVENPIFVERFKRLLKDNGFTQRSFSDFCEESGVKISRTSISLWCIGRAYPVRKNLDFVCKTFNVSPEYLFGETNYKNETELRDFLLEKQNQMDESQKASRRIKATEYLSIDKVSAITRMFDNPAFNSFTESQKLNLIEGMCELVIKEQGDYALFSKIRKNKGASKNGSDQQP